MSVLSGRETAVHMLAAVLLLTMRSADTALGLTGWVNPSFQSIVPPLHWSHSCLVLFKKWLNPYTTVVLVQLWVEQNSHCLSARILVFNLQVSNPCFMMRRRCIWGMLFWFSQKGPCNERSSVGTQGPRVRLCPKPVFRQPASPQRGADGDCTCIFCRLNVLNS